MKIFTILLVLCMATLGSSRAPYNLNVVNFGATGDGKTDDSKAFMKAWQAACAATNEITLTVPAGKTFLLQPVQFVGPCKSPKIIFMIAGNIIAPNHISEWIFTPNKGSWIAFQYVNGINVIGNGQIDGYGSEWWDCAIKNKCSRPTGMTFDSCKNIQIAGMNVKNTPGRFMSVFHCENVLISNLKITNPENSSNTDGMNLGQSTNVLVKDCQISTGDDCISVLSGSSNINITGISCIQGHGISIGSMGQNGDYDTVEEVHVKNCTFGSTTNGARIKTWQGGSGYARKISFEGINLENTSNPIIIDQFYCPEGGCPIKTKAVKISDITLRRFNGSSFSETAIDIECSKTVGCSNIIMDQINISPSYGIKEVSSKCINAHGQIGSTNPQVNCN